MTDQATTGPRFPIPQWAARRWYWVVLLGACSDQPPADTDQPVPVDPRVPVAQISYVPGRAQEPGHLTLRCVVHDQDGDLLAARISAPGTDTLHSVAGGEDTVTAIIRELPAGNHLMVCTTTDILGRVSADSITVGIDPNRPPAASLSVSRTGESWSIDQRASVDPQGDTVAYTIVVEQTAPVEATVLIIGPRRTPIDTTIALPEGSYRVSSIVHNGVAADTTRRRIEPDQLPPSVTQSVLREGFGFRYSGSFSGTFGRLTVQRARGDTIYFGPVPADTVFRGTTPEDSGGLPDGDYLFIIRATRQGRIASDVKLDSIPSSPPTVDLSALAVSLDPGDSAVVTLPIPTDRNPEDAPRYAAAVSLDGKVVPSLSGSELSLTAVPGASGTFAVQLTVGNNATGVLVDTLTGSIGGTGTGNGTAQQDSTGFKSGYNDVAVMGGATSVGADLVDDDADKHPLFGVNVARRRLGPYYNLKRRLNDRYGLAIGIDYSLVNQFSNFSTTDTHAASGIFRVYARWRVFGSKATNSGSLVARLENRHGYIPVTPRDLGGDGGSTLSTATFKDFGWGVTVFYWKQTFRDSKSGFAVGNMDPGDFSDVFPLLTAYKAFMNDASFNNPSVALPNQGLGVTGRLGLGEHWYVAGGLHDANGDPTQFGFDTFFNVREYYTWAEAGWDPGDNNGQGEGIHVNLWHADARKDAGTDETWGVTFSASRIFRKGVHWTPFFRAGYSEEDGGQRVRFIATAGAGFVVRQGDFLGLSTSLSGAPDKSLRNQWTTEAFYRLQMTENIAVTPGFQFTVHPSKTLETDVLAVMSVLRLRLAL